MTPSTQARIREILASVQQSGIAFAFQTQRQFPEYTVGRALAEIEKALEGDSFDDIGLLLAEVSREF